MHFLSVHTNYFTAWKYVTKEDQHCVESEGHPDLKNSEGPSASQAHIANRKHLSAYQVAEIVLSKRLQNRTELLAFSNQQRQEGKTDLAEFIVNRGKKAVNEVIATVWEMESAHRMGNERSNRAGMLRLPYPPGLRLPGLNIFKHEIRLNLLEI